MRAIVPRRKPAKAERAARCDLPLFDEAAEPRGADDDDDDWPADERATT